MKKHKMTKHSRFSHHGTWIILVLSILLSSCSHGLRIKNLVNYPLNLSSLDAIDSLKVSPDVIRYTGNDSPSFRNFDKDIRIQGRHDVRPVWIAQDQGCLKVSEAANVHILDFDFQGLVGDTALIRVSSGSLILENCDFSDTGIWTIQVDSSAYLELRNVRFTNLGDGAIQLGGGRVKIFNSQFDMAGKTAIHASSGGLLEAHNVILSNTMGTAMQLSSVEEVWLDSVKVMDSFQDGIKLKNCEYVLLNHVESKGNGQNGLTIEKSSISALLNYSAIGNLVHGMMIQDVDTLRVLNSEFVANGETGATIQAVNRSRMAGLSVGHNKGEGFRIRGGNELLIHHSIFQANQTVALNVDSVASAEIKHLSVANNGEGIQIRHFKDILFRNNLLTTNANTAVEFSDGNEVSASINLINDNQKGMLIHDVLHLELDSNRVASNALGTDFRSIATLNMSQNIWEDNKSGSYLSNMGFISSSQDRWVSNSGNAFEILSAKDFILAKAVLTGNGNGGLLNQASARLETCRLDSSGGFALKLMNGSLFVNQSEFYSNITGIDLAEGSRARIVQSNFKNNDLAIDVKASVSISMSFCKVYESRGGLRIGNYADAEILSNHFYEIDDYSVKLTGPHLQALHMKQNVINQTGGILWSNSNSGKIRISNNTFASNKGNFDLRPQTLSQLDHNIFYRSGHFELDILTDLKGSGWNCFFPKSEESHPETYRDLNLYVDPQFDEKYYLKLQSSCLNGGENGSLIGALGALSEKRPNLQP